MSSHTVLDLGETVAPGQGTDDPVVVKREVPFDGTVREILLSFPRGTDGKTGVAVSLGSGLRLFPHSGEDGYIYGDGADPPPLSLGERVAEDDVLQSSLVNTDTSSHHIMVMAVVSRRRPE